MFSVRSKQQGREEVKVKKAHTSDSFASDESTRNESTRPPPRSRLYGISPGKFQKTNSLSTFFEILTTTADSYDKVYVSTAQARRYPVTAVQWHPEKNAFEWASSSIPHSEDAIQVTQNVANFFVREARLSKHRPSSEEVLNNLIYNYSPAYCGKAGKGFDEV
ncbi:Gamma-glutamyl hydrolase 1 [Orobanche gracilis]